MERKGVGKSLRILILEDVASDAQIMEYELRAAGLQFISQHAKNREEFIRGLKSFSPDLVLSDYSLPQFDGNAALSAALEQVPDVPFIFVTGALGEDHAVELLKRGATDFVLKNRLSRLPIAVNRALRESEERKRRKQAEEELREAHQELERKVEERTLELKQSLALIQEKEERFWLSVETLLDAFAILSAVRDEQGQIVDFRFEYINDAGCRINEYPRQAHVAKSLLELLPAHKTCGLFDRYVHVVESGEPLILDGFLNEDLYGGRRRVAKAIDFRCARLGDGLAVSYRDVTERQQIEEELRRSRDGLEICVQERTAELLKSKEQLQYLSSRLIMAQEAERKRIAHEIHDGLTANLSALKYSVESKIKRMKQGKPVDLASLEDINSFLKVNIEETRRIMNNLRPTILDDLGLLPTLSWFLREYEKVYTHMQIQREIEIQEDEIPENLKTVIFRVVQEALNNSAKHGRGNLVQLGLKHREGKIQFHIEDNGQGFETANYKRGLGLDSMRERVEFSGGFFSIQSARGQGTGIYAWWPQDETGTGIRAGSPSESATQADGGGPGKKQKPLPQRTQK